MGHARQKTLLGFAGVASNSSGTVDVFVGDARLLSLSIQSGSNTSASRYTVSISNADGFQATIPTTSWSVVTTILGQGAYTLDPGGRWLRVERPDFSMTSGLGSASQASNCTVNLNRYYE
jgi:hypothetical protein